MIAQLILLIVLISGSFAQLFPSPSAKCPTLRPYCTGISPKFGARFCKYDSHCYSKEKCCDDACGRDIAIELAFGPQNPHGYRKLCKTGIITGQIGSQGFEQGSFDLDHLVQTGQFPRPGGFLPGGNVPSRGSFGGSAQSHHQHGSNSGFNRPQSSGGFGQQHRQPGRYDRY